MPSRDEANRLPAPDLPDWLDEQIPFSRYRIEVDDGLRMHVMEQGEGRPVVLLHGLPTWSYLYRKVAAELAADPFRLIMPDLIGLGFSDRPSPSSHTLIDHSLWTRRLLERLRLNDIVLVVQDWGGPIGLHAVSQWTGRVSGLVVLNTVVGPPKPGFRPAVLHRFLSSVPGALVTRYLGYPQRSLARMQGDPRSISGDVAKSYRYPLRGRASADSLTGMVRMTPDSMEHPTVTGLREVQSFVESFRGSAAIVWGDRDPLLGRLRNRVARSLPGATITATQAGHFLQEEVPDEVAAAIRQVALS